MGTKNSNQALQNPEERAFVYQQLQELNEFAPGLGTVAVVVEENTAPESGDEAVVVTLRFAPSGHLLDVREVGDSIYTALAKVKFSAKKVLAALYAAYDNEPGDAIQIH